VGSGGRLRSRSCSLALRRSFLLPAVDCTSCRERRPRVVRLELDVVLPPPPLRALLRLLAGGAILGTFDVLAARSTTEAAVG